jgi:membrane-bound lytic murein transglycosylase A
LLAAILVGACAPIPHKPEPLSCPAAQVCPACPLCPAPKPAPVAETLRYLESQFAALPGWASADLQSSLRAFVAGCPRLTGSAALASVCERARAVPAGDELAARQFFEAEFVPYSIVSSESGDTGMITGYYEPVISGSRKRSAMHRHPIFALPSDLVVVDLAGTHPELRNSRLRGRLEGRRLIPYYSRAEIDSQGVGFGAPVIAWTHDPVELFFLQIQGSGQIQLEGGERIRVGYADQNGHPYRSLGRYLVDRGDLPLEQASMQGIKAWAAANPARLQEALNHNASYVFFREQAATGGPLGALGVPLTAEYSLAVDRRFVPLGAPVFLASTYPLSDTPLQRLMSAQDVGGAIRGVVRADFFWGLGPEAGALAGRMRQAGKMWLLWPRGEPLPRAD